MSDFLSVYITVASEAEGEKIAQTLIEERLANCANLISNLKSVYRWKGKVEKANECALIIKMTADRFSLLEKRVRELHSYECPCIVATPITAGSGAYLAWLKD